MSEEESTPEEENVVTGSLASALGLLEGNDPDQVSDPESEPVDKIDSDSTKDETEEKEEVKLSAKQLLVKKKREEERAKHEPIQEPPAPKAPEEPKVDKKPKPDYSGFEKRERETLELLEFGAEKELSDKDAAKKLAEYYKSKKEFIKRLKEDNLDDEDWEMDRDAMNRWRKENPPPVDVETLEDIRNERLVSLAEERALKRLRAEQEKADKEREKYMRELEKDRRKPEVERTVSEFSDSLLEKMPEEITKSLRKGKDWSDIETESPIEAPIVQKTLNEYADKAEMAVSLMQGVVDFDKSNALQRELKDFLKKQGDILERKPPEKTKRNGKAFVHPAKYDPSDNTTWTFTQSDVLAMLKNKALKEANRRIDQEKKRFDLYAKRKGIGSVAQKGESVDEESSPSVKASPTPPIGGTQSKRSGGLFDMLN